MTEEGPINQGIDDETFVERALRSVPDLPADAVARTLRSGVAAGRGRLARHRRRFVVTGALAVTVVAVGTVGGVRAVTDTTSGPAQTSQPPPVGPGHSRRPTENSNRGSSHRSDWSVAGPDAGLSWVVFSGESASFAGWRIATPGPLMFGWTRTSDGWQTAEPVHVLNGPIGSEATNGDAILSYGARRARLLQPDGSTVPLRFDDHASPARPGEALFGTNWETSLAAFDPATRVAHLILPAPGLSRPCAAAWDNRGRLWVEGWQDGTQRVYVAWSADGGATWSRHLVSGGNSYPGGLGVDSANGQVAAFAWKGSRERTIRSASVITYDGGATWDAFDRGIGPRRVDDQGYPGGAAAVTTLNNRLFAVDSGSHELWEATGTWRSFQRVHTPLPVTSVQANGRLLWAIASGKPYPTRFLVSSDAGVTWRLVSPR